MKCCTLLGTLAPVASLLSLTLAASSALAQPDAGPAPLPQPAWASADHRDAGAPPAKEAGPSYETVVVGNRSKVKSATLTDTPWIELPQSVQVVTSRALQSWAVETPNEAWKLTSGVFPSDQELQSRYGGFGRMRGVQGSQTLLNGFTMPQRMSLYYDLTSIEQMEILKGPADALDGTQTPSLTLGGFGGQINLASRAPERLPSVLASLAAHGLGGRRLRFTLQGNRPLHETLSARLDTAGQLGQRFFVPSSYPAEWFFSTAPAISLSVRPSIMSSTTSVSRSDSSGNSRRTPQP